MKKYIGKEIFDLMFDYYETDIKFDIFNDDCELFIKDITAREMRKFLSISILTKRIVYISERYKEVSIFIKEKLL